MSCKPSNSSITCCRTMYRSWFRGSCFNPLPWSWGSWTRSFRRRSPIIRSIRSSLVLFPLKNRVIDDTFRLSKCVQIARLYLEDDDAVNAEAFINKASLLVSSSQHESFEFAIQGVLCEDTRFEEEVFGSCSVIL